MSNSNQFQVEIHGTSATGSDFRLRVSFGFKTVLLSLGDTVACLTEQQAAALEAALRMRKEMQ